MESPEIALRARPLEADDCAVICGAELNSRLSAARLMASLLTSGFRLKPRLDVGAAGPSLHCDSGQTHGVMVPLRSLADTFQIVSSCPICRPARDISVQDGVGLPGGFIFLDLLSFANTK